MHDLRPPRSVPAGGRRARHPRTTFAAATAWRGAARSAGASSRPGALAPPHRGRGARRRRRSGAAGRRSASRGAAGEITAVAGRARRATTPAPSPRFTRRGARRSWRRAAGTCPTPSPTDIYIHLDEDRERFRRNQRLVDARRARRLRRAARRRARRSRAWPIRRGRARAGAIVRAACADSLEREILARPQDALRPDPHRRHLAPLVPRSRRRLHPRSRRRRLLHRQQRRQQRLGPAGRRSASTSAATTPTNRRCRAARAPAAWAWAGCSIWRATTSTSASQWCQGVGYFGIGWLRDLGGQRHLSRAQLLPGGRALRRRPAASTKRGQRPLRGRRSRAGRRPAARASAPLIDRAGDDEYYAKGLYPTNYGDAGIFDAWSQGCGMGFRTIASGGLGLLRRRWRRATGWRRATSRQGGGYYYGLGILHARGAEGDVYIGSRYNQGFTAHQAVGVFLEDGGDDLYTTRQAVAQGLAWDECVTVFDRRRRATTSTRAAAASRRAPRRTTAFCLFRDRGGRDTYDYPPGPGAGRRQRLPRRHQPLALRRRGRRGGRLHRGRRGERPAIRYAPEHGFFLDLPGIPRRGAAQRCRR